MVSDMEQGQWKPRDNSGGSLRAMNREMGHSTVSCRGVPRGPAENPREGSRAATAGFE